MAHYAFLDEKNIVTEVIVGRNEDEVVDGISDWEQYYGSIRGQRCVRTSYNAATTGYRKQYAGIGYKYDEAADQFVAPQPFPSWSLDSNNDWQAPVQKPEGDFYWDEDQSNWIEFIKSTNEIPDDFVD
jgi:hypothetical protein